MLFPNIYNPFQNVYAVVNFSYEDNLVEGTISSANNRLSAESNKPELFDVLIQIYGFNKTMLNVNPAYILNKDQQFNGVLKPNYQQKNQQSLSLTEEDLKAIDELDLDYDDAIDDNDTGDEEDDEYDEDDFNNNYDKIIEQGQRQEGKSMILFNWFD